MGVLSDGEEQPPRKIRRIDDDNGNAQIKLSTGKSGRIGMDRADWKKIPDKIKAFVKEYNAAVSHKEDVSEIQVPSNVIIQKSRRAQRMVNGKDKDNNANKEELISTIKNKLPTKKRITFNLDSSDEDEE